MEQTLKSFERGYEELRVAFNENMQVKFGEVREAEAIMHKDLSDAVSLFAERFLKGEVENAMELPHELVAVLFLCLNFVFFLVCPSINIQLSNFYKSLFMVWTHDMH